MDEFDQNPPSETGDRTSKTEETGTVPGTEPPLPASDEAHAASLRPLLATTLPIVQREHYAIEGERDRGGLGRILQGRDRRLDRPVAIKQLLTHDSQARARFVREALVSARLQHPAIVPVYEAGRWPDGEPFYAMKLISGRSLKEIVDEALSLDQRLALMPHILAVADAMAYAHEQRVIHRDLKPSNVLVGRFGETVVIDWGLAKDLGRAEASEEESWDNPYDIATHDLTVDGSVMGTPHYMPPEQGRGEPVDERADVYAIGAMLYHLLAGTPPYTGDKSTEVVERLLAGPPLPLEERQPGVPMDLAAIVRKAMARAKEERYPSARELAEDLHRFHTGQLVAAHEYSRWTLAGRWLKRHRLPVAVAGLALIVLCLEGWLAVRRIVHERNRAEQQRTDAEQQRRHAEAQRNRVILEQARGLLERDPTATLAVLKTYPRDAADRRTVRELILMAQSTGVARHVFRGDLGNLCDGDFSPDGKLYASSGYGRVLSIWDVDTGRVVQQWPVQQPVYGIRFSPDGERLAYIGPRTHHLFLRSLRTGVERTLAVEGQGLVNDFAFSPRGDWILILTDAQSLYVRPMAEGKPRVLDHHESTSTASAFSPDGQWIAYAGDDRSIRLYELASGRVRSLRGHGAAVTALAFTREGRLASASRDGTARIWDPASGASLRILRGHRASVRNLAFSPDGRRLATGGEDETVRIWDVATGAEEGLERHEGRVNTLAFSPDGRYLTWAGAGSIVHLRDLVTQESRTLLGHRAEIGRVHFSSDGRYLASNSNDKTARLWALPPSRSRILLGHQGNIQSAKFSPDGKVLATASRDHTIRLWDTSTGQSIGILRGHHNLIPCLAFSPDGTHVASVSWDKTVMLWELPSGPPVVFEGHTDIVGNVVFSPDGQQLFTSGLDGSIWRWDLVTRKGRPLRGHRGDVLDLAISPDGARLASAGEDAAVYLWQPDSGSHRRLSGPTHVVNRIVFSPDGRLLAAADAAGEVWLWDLATERERLLGHHPAGVRALQFSPDARSLVSGDEEGLIQRWDTVTGAPRPVAMLHTLVRKLEFPRDGHLLAALGLDGTVWLWSYDTGELRDVHRECRDGFDIALSPDGKQLACGGFDWKMYLWTTSVGPEAPLPTTALHEWLEKMTSTTLLSSGLPATP